MNLFVQMKRHVSHGDCKVQSTVESNYISKQRPRKSFGMQDVSRLGRFIRVQRQVVLPSQVSLEKQLRSGILSNGTEIIISEQLNRFPSG